MKRVHQEKEQEQQWDLKCKGVKQRREEGEEEASDFLAEDKQASDVLRGKEQEKASNFHTVLSSENRNSSALFVHTRLLNTDSNVQCEAQLLLDTGFTGCLLLSQHKAQQLKLQELSVVHMEGIKGDVPAVTYNSVNCKLLMECGEGPSAALRVIAPARTNTPASAQGSCQDEYDWLADLEEEESCSKPKPVEVSPIREGKDSLGHFSLLGYTGFKELGLGLQPYTRELIIARPSMKRLDSIPLHGDKHITVLNEVTGGAENAPRFRGFAFLAAQTFPTTQFSFSTLRRSYGDYLSDLYRKVSNFSFIP